MTEDIKDADTFFINDDPKKTIIQIKENSKKNFTEFYSKISSFITENQDLVSEKVFYDNERNELEEKFCKYKAYGNILKVAVSSKFDQHGYDLLYGPTLEEVKSNENKLGVQKKRIREYV